MSTWLILAIAGSVAAIDTATLFQGMINQPLVICTLLGAAVGLPLEGAYLGAFLQMLWLSELPVGGAVSSDSGPASAGAAGGALVAIQSGLTDMGIAGLAVLLAAIPLAWVGGYLVRWQRELQRGFFPRVIAALERNRPGMVRWYLLVGIGHSAIRGVLIALLAAALSLLLITIAGLLPLAGKIAPYTLLAGMLGVGLGATRNLYGGPQFLPWLIGGLAAGTFIVVFF